MSFNPNIPQPSDNLSVSQGNLLTNFSTINTYFGRDHFAFNAGSNNGYHQQVNMPGKSSPPSAAISSGGVIWGKTLTTSSNCGPAWAMQSGTGYTVPVVYNIGSVSVTAGNSSTPNNVNNFSGIAQMMGMVYAFDLSNFTRTLISPFWWDGTNINFPGGSTGDGQVPSGGALLYFQGSGSQAQIVCKNITTTINVRYIGDLI